jgi:hypothetical protein
MPQFSRAAITMFIGQIMKGKKHDGFDWRTRPRQKRS